MPSVETIERRGRVTYRGIPWIVLANGTRKKGPTKTFDSESAAMAYAVRVERGSDDESESRGLPVTRNKRRVLFADYAMQYAVRTPGTANTKRNRISKAEILGEWFAKLYIDEIDRKLINDLLYEMSKPLPGKPHGFAPGTKRGRISFLRCVFEEAVLDKLIDENPCRNIEKPNRVSLRGHNPPNEDELAALIEYMPDWFEVAILLANDSGLRAAEVSGLRWHRIDFGKRLVTVKDVMEKDGSLRPYPKGKEQRILPLSDRTIAALRRAKLRQGAGDLDYVLRRPNGDKVNPHNLSAFWYRHAKKVKGISQPYPVFHDLRHGCAHRLVASGVSMPVLQTFMGHKSIATTQIYMPDVTVSQLADALSAVPVPEAAPVVTIAGTGA